MKCNHPKFIKILNYCKIKKKINPPVPNIFQVDLQIKILKNVSVKFNRTIAKNQIKEYRLNQLIHS